MIFSELYGAYYNTVAKILAAAVKHPITRSELREIIERNAFGESVLNIEPAIVEERWQLLRPDGSTPMLREPTMPLTTLEKRWLKAIFSDPRIKLFTDEEPDLPGIEPLFTPDDILIFDKYSDGDPYGDEAYIRNFRLILDAIRSRHPLRVDVINRNCGVTRMTLMPDHLEYSEKDDKFRLVAGGCRHGWRVNLAGIIACEPYENSRSIRIGKKVRSRGRTVEFELYDRRNALERVLMHFAHFEKRAEKIGEDRYKVTVSYDNDDETEIVIRILSFGPMVKVTAPEHFVDLIKKRLTDQKSCER